MGIYMAPGLNNCYIIIAFAGAKRELLPHRVSLSGVEDRAYIFPYFIAPRPIHMSFTPLHVMPTFPWALDDTHWGSKRVPYGNMGHL